MTDPEFADATYVEPITPEIVATIIEKERPDALLPTMGGQTALNCALSLRRMGVLEKFGVNMIGATAEAIDKAEDRELFREAMARIGLETPKSSLANASDLKKADRELYQAGIDRIAARGLAAEESRRAHRRLTRAPGPRAKPSASAATSPRGWSRRSRPSTTSASRPSSARPSRSPAPAAASPSTRRNSWRSSSAASTPRRPPRC